jgi:hypothetical protein
MRRMRREARPLVSWKSVNPGQSRYVRFIPITSQRVCLILPVSLDIRGSPLPTTPSKNAPPGTWILAFLSRVRKDHALNLVNIRNTNQLGYRENKFRTKISPLARKPEISIDVGAATHRLVSNLPTSTLKNKRRAVGCNLFHYCRCCYWGLELPHRRHQVQRQGIWFISRARILRQTGAFSVDSQGKHRPVFPDLKVS